MDDTTRLDALREIHRSIQDELAALPGTRFGGILGGASRMDAETAERHDSLVIADRAIAQAARELRREIKRESGYDDDPAAHIRT